MRGYIAITTVLIIGVIVLMISLTTALTSVNQTQYSLNNNFKSNTLSFVESCVDDALIKLNLNNSLPSDIILPIGTCTLTVNSNIGNLWDFTVTGSSNFITKSIRVSVTRDTTIQLNSWQEI
jgi:maltose-binding protein MalE